MAFTGAGVSAESGIPTFRDPGGLWDRFSPDDFGTGGLSMLTGLSSVGREFLQEMLDTFSQAGPNPGHLALAELEGMGILRSVITQNVDNLHIEAGNTKVIEVHGNFYRFRCLVCGERFKLQREELLSLMRRIAEASGELDLQGLIPTCRCGGIARIDAVGFGKIRMAFYPWIQINRYGWFYCREGGPWNGVLSYWLYSSKVGWVWTLRELFPVAYSQDFGMWMRLDTTGSFH